MPPSEAQYNPETQMIRVAQHSGGYHTQVADGVMVHPTRNTMRWAVHQLAHGDETQRQQANDAIAKLLSLQDTDPTSPTYGIWSWLLEEPLDKMAPPDWNWADFLGLELARALTHHVRTLRTTLVPEVRKSLRHAALAIFRRNVTPGYTNICALGAAVCARAGELLDMSWLTDYATQRLTNMVDAAEAAGNVPEYNSPTYYPVAIEAAEFILNACQGQGIRTAATRLHQWMWRQIAEAYHPATGQWAGPHARAYADTLRVDQKRWLGLRGAAQHAAAVPDESRPVEAIDCPEPLLPRLAALPSLPFESRTPLCEHGTYDQRSSTRFMQRCMDDRCCMTSVTSEDTWTQRRTLIGYARTNADNTAVIRTRLTHDGRDFASGCVRQLQQGMAVLSVFGLTLGRGYWHVSLDRPEDQRFTLGELAIVYEFAGHDTRVTALDECTYVFETGGVSALVKVGEACIDGNQVQWRCEQREGSAVVTCSGPVSRPGPIRLDELGPTYAIAGVTWFDRERADEVARQVVESTIGGDEVNARWGELVVTAPLTATQI